MFLLSEVLQNQEQLKSLLLCYQVINLMTYDIVAQTDVKARVNHVEKIPKQAAETGKTRLFINGILTDVQYFLDDGNYYNNDENSENSNNSNGNIIVAYNVVSQMFIAKAVFSLPLPDLDEIAVYDFGYIEFMKDGIKKTIAIEFVQANKLNSQGNQNQTQF